MLGFISIKKNSMMYLNNTLRLLLAQASRFFYSKTLVVIMFGSLLIGILVQSDFCLNIWHTY